MTLSSRWLTCLLCLGLSTAAYGAPPDLATSAGYAQTCASVPAAPKDDDARVAAVVCRDTALVKQIVTWAMTGMERMRREKPGEGEMIKEITREIDYVIGELGKSRAQLAQIKLGARTSLRLVPAQWQLDLDSDGKMALWEQNLFAIPKRGGSGFRFSAPSNDPDYYEREYNLSAAIRVDQSDVLWALAYHNFIEGLLTNVRAFDLDMRSSSITIARPEMLKRAHKLIGSGMATSAAMRQAVLKEKDDDEEWIGHPQQASSVFPIPLDEMDFAAWGEILQELMALWNGRTLLPVAQGGRGMLAEIAPLCPPGTALNIARLYNEPPPAGTPFRLGSRAKLPTTHCQTVDDKHKVSNLPELAEKASKTDTGMRFLRYLYWTN